jgi:tRNA (guanine-N7-)-methyltransferase
MGHHGQMHLHSGVRVRPDTPAVGPDATRPQQRFDEGGAGRRLPASSFRSRHSALSDTQRQTWDRLWPELGMSVVPGPACAEPLDTRAWFGRSAPVVLEIDREQVSNIRFIRGNGIDVLEHLIAPRSLIGVRVFFPDPWPKARHHKRRFLQPGTVDLIADRLLPGGVLHAATDHPGYAEQIAEVGDAESRLVRVYPGTESLPISIVRPTTKYETKAQHAGSADTELIWKKR